jgi:hypothetical protein
MAQRPSQAALLCAQALTVEKHMLALVTSPVSEWKEDISPREWEALQAAKRARAIADQIEKSDEISTAIKRTGLNSPRVRRLLREYYQDDLDVGYIEEEGMRN